MNDVWDGILIIMTVVAIIGMILITVIAIIGIILILNRYAGGITTNVIAIIGIILILTGCAGGIEGAIQTEQKIADGITAVDEKTHGILAIISTSGQILHLVSELHKAGVDTEVIMAIQDAMDKAYAIAEKENFKLKGE